MIIYQVFITDQIAVFGKKHPHDADIPRYALFGYAVFAGQPYCRKALIPKHQTYDLKNPVMFITFSHIYPLKRITG